MQHRRDQPEHVHRGQHDRAGADRRPPPGALEDACEDEELAGERCRPGHGERDHADDHQQCREGGSPACHPAEQPELSRGRPSLDGARDEEERDRDETVRDHLQHRPIEAEVGAGEEAERDQPRLREGGVRDDSSEVGRAEGEQRAVDERGGGEREHRRPVEGRRVRELRDRDPQHPVQARLRDHAGQDGGNLRRCLAVRVGQPAVEREQRRLDDEGEHETEEEPAARTRRAVHEVERPRLQPVRDDRGEHQQRAGHGVDDELDRRLGAPRAAPDPDQDVERDQHRLEEGVEEEQVLGLEHTDGRAGEQQHQPEVRAWSVAPDPEAVAGARGHPDDGEADEPEREAVDADVVRDAEVAEPVRALLHLQARLREVEACRLLDPEADLGEREEQCQAPRRVAGERQQPDEDRAGDRQPDQDRGEGGGVHLAIRKARTTPAAPAARNRT